MTTTTRPVHVERIETIETLKSDLGVLTRRLDQILQWEREGQCTAVYLLVYGGPIMAQIIQTYDRIQALEQSDD